MSTRRGSRGALDLRDQLGRPDDRAGDEVGEEREIDRELLERRRLEVTTVGVDDVADRHEREERDADREDNRLQRERQVEADDRGHVVTRGDEEVVVLEVAEHAEVPGEREDEKRLPLRLHTRAPDAHREHLVPERAAREQEDEAPVPPAVEDVARGDDERPPAVRPRHRQPRERQDDQEEDGESGGRKEHAPRKPRFESPSADAASQTAGRCSIVDSGSSSRGGRRVTSVTLSPPEVSRRVCSTGGVNHAGSAPGGTAGMGA